MRQIATHCRTCLPILLAAALTAGACSGTSQPTAVSPSAIPQSLEISGARPLTQGESVALTAIVRFASGATESVTDGASWSSDDPRVATVSDRGVVTAVGPGEARIRAAVKSVSGTTTLGVVAALASVTGQVHETLPTEAVAIRGAIVTIVAADGSTQSATSDTTGAFAMSVRRGPARVTVMAAGYETASSTMDIDGTSLSLGLAPVMREVLESFAYIYPPRRPSAWTR